MLPGNKRAKMDPDAPRLDVLATGPSVPTKCGTNQSYSTKCATHLCVELFLNRLCFPRLQVVLPSPLPSEHCDVLRSGSTGATVDNQVRHRTPSYSQVWFPSPSSPSLSLLSLFSKGISPLRSRRCLWHHSVSISGSLDSWHEGRAQAATTSATYSANWIPTNQHPPL